MKPVQKPLTLERLKELLSYDPVTGIFRWKVKQSRRNKVGDQAGSVHKDTGYRNIQIDRVPYSAGRLAWFYCHGMWPHELIDHRDLNKDNNRLENLREATGTQNRRNVGILCVNTSGFKGVSRYSSSNRSKPWRATIRKDGKRIFLGAFASASDAAAAYQAAAIKYHAEFARF